MWISQSPCQTTSSRHIVSCVTKHQHLKVLSCGNIAVLVSIALKSSTVFSVSDLGIDSPPSHSDIMLSNSDCVSSVLIDQYGIATLRFRDLNGSVKYEYWDFCIDTHTFCSNTVLKVSIC